MDERKEGKEEEIKGGRHMLLGNQKEDIILFKNQDIEIVLVLLTMIDNKTLIDSTE